MTPAQKEKQQEHAANISAESHLMKSLGTTREQARRTLREFRETERAADAAKALKPSESSTAAPPPFSITSDTRSFDAQPLTLAGPGRQGEPAQDKSSTLLEDVYVTAAGHLIITNIQTDGRADPV